MRRLSLRRGTRSQGPARWLVIGWFWGVCLLYPSHAAPYGAPHVYIGPEAILTLEIVNPRDVILNVINLSDYLFVFEPKNLIVKSKSGRTSIGQIIDKPETDNRGNTWKYSAKLLIPSRTSEGVTVRGAFAELNAVDTILIKFGGRRFYLDRVPEAEFNTLAGKIGDIDLKAADFSKTFAALQLPSLGKLRFPTGPETSQDDQRELLTAEGVNPPRVIERTPVQPTDAARKAGIHGTVKVTALITKDGDLLNPKVSKGLGYGLDERALEAIKNSWRFLPATKDGELVDATVTLNVEF